MADDRGDEKNDIHNEGQGDGAENKYDPPTVHTWFISDEKFAEEMEDKEAYDKGWEEGYKKR